MRRKDRLADAQIGQELHLRQSLKRRFAGIGNHLPMLLGGKISLRQPGIVMRGADQSVEIDFDCWHNVKESRLIPQLFNRLKLEK